MPKNPRVQKRRGGNKISVLKKSKTLPAEERVMIETDERFQMLNSCIPIICEAKDSEGAAIDVVFNTLSGVTWITNDALQKLKHRLFKAKSTYSEFIPPLGEVQVDHLAKFFLCFQSDSEGDNFEVEIEAIVVHKDWSGDQVVIGVDTMVKEEVDILTSKGRILFRDGSVVIADRPSYKKILCNFEVVTVKMVHLQPPPDLLCDSQQENTEAGQDIPLNESFHATQIDEVIPETPTEVGDASDMEALDDGE